MDGIDTTGKALVDHWKWAAEKGLMNTNTAGALRAASAQVLGVLDGWETLDVRALDVDDVLRRFVNKRSKDFKPDSLETYKRRFTLAVRQFLEYANNPGSWKAPAQERTARRGRERTPDSTEPDEPSVATTGRSAVPPAAVSGLVEYPFPLREGRFAYLRLPADLNQGDVRRLTAYLSTLVVDSSSND